MTLWENLLLLIYDLLINNNKEQYCIGTWNVKSKNQGKLEVVKQEIARVNIDILGISERRWTGMGEFNSNKERSGRNEYVHSMWHVGTCVSPSVESMCAYLTRNTPGGI